MKVYVHHEDCEIEDHRLTLLLSLPKKWNDKPVKELLQLFIESYNTKKPENLLDTETYHLRTSSGRDLANLEIISSCFSNKDDVYVVKGVAPEVSQPKPIDEIPEENTQTEEKEIEKTEETHLNNSVRCKNYGCHAYFVESENHDSACHYHSGQPIFHDVKKGWSCCTKRVYDWDEFEKIQGCSIGRHSTVDPKVSFAQSPTVALAEQAEKKYGSESAPVLKSIDAFNKENPEAITAAKSAQIMTEQAPRVSTRRSDGTATCKRKGCQKDFIVIDNHPTACRYHRGEGVFHDTKKFWACCPNIVKYDFDSFLAIPGCCEGYHDDGEINI